MQKPHKVILSLEKRDVEFELSELRELHYILCDLFKTSIADSILTTIYEWTNEEEKDNCIDIPQDSTPKTLELKTTKKIIKKPGRPKKGAK